MKWRSYLPSGLILALAVALNAWDAITPSKALVGHGVGWTSQRKLAVRETTRDLWYHGFNSYMRNAFPLDELSPLSCTGRGPDWANPHNISTNDVAGNFSLTLVDVLDTLVVLGDVQGFDQAVRNVIDWVSFDVNTKPQLFEVTIRVLGGLLSGHIFANQSGPFHLPWYRGELLDMAHDLGERLLPAFATATGLPYARINLRRGLIAGETSETCTAGAGSLILEFATLSRLTGDTRFEKAAYKAFFAIWNRRSDIGLVGNTINIWTGAWTAPEVTGIGAGIDSFYEYALKWYVLSGDVEFLDVWDEAYASIMRYARATDGFWYRNVNIHTGTVAYYNVDSLSAFWPGLQVLAGDVQNAIQSHMMYWNLWKRHSGLPEVWDINYKQATSFQYPLRPEFIESTWYLYRATRDPFYLDVGERVLNDIIYRSKVECGLTGIQDLRANARDDRMESFALSETLKYLYLLFDEENSLHSDDSNYVFTTEGHILSLGQEHLRPVPLARRKMRGVESHQCPVYYPFIRVYDDWENSTGLVEGIRSRQDFDYARELVGLLPEDADKLSWSPDGWCQTPKIELFSYDFVLSKGGQVIAEDTNPGPQKISIIPSGYILHNVTGIRAHIVKRLDGQGYDITRLGPYAVRTGQIVYVDDPELFLSMATGGETTDKDGKPRIRDPDVKLRFFFETVDAMFKVQTGFNDATADMEAFETAYTALFGGDLSPNYPPDAIRLRFESSEGLPISQETSNPLGCSPYTQLYADTVLLVSRGKCSFLEKLLYARAAGAAGVLVVSDEESGINPTASKEELQAAGDLTNTTILLLTRTAGQRISEIAEAAEIHGGQIMVSLDPERVTKGGDTGPDLEHFKDSNRVLYLSGHPLLNTRLMM